MHLTRTRCVHLSAGAVFSLALFFVCYMAVGNSWFTYGVPLVYAALYGALTWDLVEEG